jgi:hypothetical protein
MNKERLSLFLAVYSVELEKCVMAFPEKYAWSLTELPVVLVRMASGIERGSFNKDSAAFSKTCKAFGIKHTYKAISEFLNHEAEAGTVSVTSQS